VSARSGRGLDRGCGVNVGHVGQSEVCGVGNMHAGSVACGLDCPIGWLAGSGDRSIDPSPRVLNSM
jgi:hypothetical protein